MENFVKFFLFYNRIRYIEIFFLFQDETKEIHEIYNVKYFT